MVFADVVMPFMMPYMAWLWFFPVTFVALVLEMIVFKLAYRDLRASSTVAFTLGANAASWFLGLLIVVLLLPSDIKKMSAPSGAGFYFGHGPNYDRDMVLAIPVAFGLSVLLEWIVWKLVFRKHPKNLLFLMTTLANVLSYALLITVMSYL